MTCYHPIPAWRSTEPNDNQKYPPRFYPYYDGQDPDLHIPCGQCIGCKIKYSKDWATRMVHESTLHEDNCFITLTYNEEHLPSNQSLEKKVFQDFMKKLRHHITQDEKEFKKANANIPFSPQKIRYYACGEYGENHDLKTTNTIGRPHYHAILFGYDFKDKEIYSDNNQMPLYTSQTLEAIWGKGFITIGKVNFDTCAYVARYVTKKITGEKADEHYEIANTTTGEITNLRPEFSLCSRGGKTSKTTNAGGIGKGWYNRWKDDTIKGSIALRGVLLPIPKTYKEYITQEEDYITDIHNDRIRIQTSILNASPDNTPDRLAVREHITKKRLSRLKRKL